MDAMGVRKNIEVQGKELNKLLKKPINISRGHTIFEVLIGLIIGAGSALIHGFIMGFLSF
jgi:acid phosphatase family membrane protein YuiD